MEALPSTGRSSRLVKPAPIAEWVEPTTAQFRTEILSANRPAVLRQIAREWPVVTVARDDPDQCMEMLTRRSTDARADVLRAEPDVDGCFHYTADGTALNFIRGQGNLPGLIALLRDQARSDRPYAIAAQGLLADRYLPGFSKAHVMPFVPLGTEPRLWIGSAGKVATHNDPVDNIAVVAAGHRRFTLFPPDAEPDLYMGPAHPTPAGTPISMVHVTAPDLDKFPRYASALAVAQQAELSPGDAIFIPRDWYHHVEALDRFNMLVNYWWDSSARA